MKVGFIGTGNMGGALCLAVRNSGEKELEIFLSDHSMGKALELSRKTNGEICSNTKIAAICDFIFLGVKPRMMKDVLTEIAPKLKSRLVNNHIYTLITMAAGISTEEICEDLNFASPVIRIMPNTPVAVGEGVIVFSANEVVSKDVVRDFTNLLEASGSLYEMSENLIDAASALSGCGPAFVCMFIEALSDGAVSCGLSREMALKLAAQTVSGTARMVLSGIHPARLKDDVCSPGGTTIEGVRLLEKGALRASVMNAVIAAYEKTEVLSEAKKNNTNNSMIGHH